MNFVPYGWIVCFPNCFLYFIIAVIALKELVSYYVDIITSLKHIPYIIHKALFYHPEFSFETYYLKIWEKEYDLKKIRNDNNEIKNNKTLTETKARHRKKHSTGPQLRWGGPASNKILMDNSINACGKEGRSLRTGCIRGADVCAKRRPRD